MKSPSIEANAGAGFPLLELEHPLMTARVALHGAHVMSWQPSGTAPVLYLSPDAVFRQGKAIRGGVPVCWPWFGTDPAGQGRPSHGFARTKEWQLAARSESAGGVRLEFSLPPDEMTRTLWPHAVSLSLIIELGSTLRMALTAENGGAEAVPLTAALHTYFAIGDIRRLKVRGLEGIPWLDTTVEPPQHRAASNLPVEFSGEVDRIYAGTGLVKIHDEAGGRIISLTSSGSRSTVVWNPWSEKAATLSDLPDDGFQRFVCVETANAGDDVITLAPGARHTLGMEIAVLPEENLPSALAS